MMETEKRISFSLISIQEEKFEISDTGNSTIKEVNVQYLVETEVHPVDGMIYVRTGIRYRREESIICECILGIRFAIKDFDTVVTIDEDSKKINFTSNVMPTFLSITYGALRGALYERVKNTPLESFPLPLMSMSELEINNHYRVVK